MVDLPADLPLLRVDATLIDQVLANLLENAAKYTPAGTLIRLRAEVRDAEVIVSVEDFGAGLAPEEFERIFAKFHRGNGEGAIRGAGLGLPICRAIVAPARREDLGGASPRRRHRLPLHVAPRGRAGSAGRGGMTEPRPTIVLVEDEPEIRRFLRSSLSSEGYRVVESGNGARGSVDAGTHKADMAIVDLALPDIDGVEVIRRIRRWSSMPILVLSARVQERSKIEALDAGADDYVTKPFGVGELLARVRVALRRASRPSSGDRSSRSGR